MTRSYPEPVFGSPEPPRFRCEILPLAGCLASVLNIFIIVLLIGLAIRFGDDRADHSPASVEARS